MILLAEKMEDFESSNHGSHSTDTAGRFLAKTISTNEIARKFVFVQSKLPITDTAQHSTAQHSTAQHGHSKLRQTYDKNKSVLNQSETKKQSKY